MTRFNPLLAICSLLLLNPTAIHAQNNSIGNRDLDGQSLKLGETDLVPSLQISFESTDNIFRSEENELDGDRFVVNPELFWSADRRLLSLNAKYEGNYAIASEDALSFTDHLLDFTADAEFSSKHRSRGTLAIEVGHDDFGRGVLSDATAENPDEVAEFTNIEWVGSHAYGSNSAKGNISGGLRLESNNFRNQPLFTSGRDFVRTEPFIRFSYRVSADTRVLLGGRLSFFSFDNENRDRVDSTIFTGVDFSATGKLSGVFLIGATQSDFSSATRDDRNSLFLVGELSYKPTSFSEWTLDLRRELDNARGDTSVVESAIETNISASWNHQWSSRITTEASIGWDQFDASCPDPSDAITTSSLEVDFALRRWISFGLNASLESRSASNCVNATADTDSLEDYDRSGFGAFIRGTL